MPDEPIAPASDAPKQLIADAPNEPKGAIGINSEQLKARLLESSASGQKALLKSLGFESEDAAKSAFKKLADLETASLSDREKLERQIAELAPKAARGDAAHARLTAMVDAQFQSLSPAVQAVIDASANGDPEKRLDLMAVVQAAMGSAPPPAPRATAPASLGPGASPPSTAVATKFDEWQSHSKRSAMLGDLFYANNSREIERTRPTT